MQWVKAADFPEDLDLSRIDEQLHEEQIPHRFTMESNTQVLWLAEPGNTQEVLGKVQYWLENPDSSNVGDKSSNRLSKSSFRLGSKPAPVTLFLVALGFVGSGLAAFGAEFISPFTFLNQQVFFFPNESIFRDISGGEYWRLLTPIFLHFGPTHSIFNMLFLWYLGTMIERNSGAPRLLALVVLIAIVSNVSQALVISSSTTFGGMSGVVHGLLSYVWLTQKIYPSEGYELPNALFIIMTVLMLLSPFGILDLVAGGEVADTAHIVGYITGIISALIIYLFNKTDQNYEL